jgi:ABC-type spermidine/putrescine transport system permease subunit I
MTLFAGTTNDLWLLAISATQLLGIGFAFEYVLSASRHPLHLLQLLAIFLVIPLSLVTRVLAMFAIFYVRFGIVDTSNLKVTTDPIDCLYFSITTFTTLGYGDFRPSVPIRLLAGTEALVGDLALAAFIWAVGRLGARR